MRRRDFIAGGAAAIWPMSAWAQQALPVIGHMHAGLAAANRDEVAAFERGLQQRGYTRGQNVTIQYLWAEGKYDQLPVLVRELIDNRVNLIIAGTPVAGLRCRQRCSPAPTK